VEKDGDGGGCANGWGCVEGGGHGEAICNVVGEIRTVNPRTFVLVQDFEMIRE
jgi:hypothetical protein